MMQQYCFNCMNSLDGGTFCPRCGQKIDSAAKEPYHLPPGTVLADRYVLGKALGEGGFGITYIGMDTTLSKRVAIKEYYPSGIAARDCAVSTEVTVPADRQRFFSEGVERFLLEAKSVAAFSDEEGIVDVQDYFHHNNTAYIVMEFLDGENLQQYMGIHGLFEAETLVALMLPVMKALGDMHAKGMIHRDISPDNIMYTKKGKLKLMDFGSAKAYNDDERQQAIVLKQGFAPEEQFRRDGEQGPFTDVYALCATIYTCITGKVPQISRERAENDELAPPSALGFSISTVYEQALMHGLAVFADERTPDMDTLIAEFTTKTPVNIETANTITYHGKKKNTDNPKQENKSPDKPKKAEQKEEPSKEAPPKEPPASPDEYLGAKKKTNATVIPDEQPTPQKPLWQTLLPVVIPAVLVVGLIIGGIVMLVNSQRDKQARQQADATTEAATTLNIQDLLSGIDNTRPTVAETTAGTTETEPTATAPAPLSLDEAKEHRDELKSFFLDNVEHNDTEARYGERIELRNIYYSESKTDSEIVYVAFLYRNVSADYFKVLYVPAAQLAVTDGKLTESSTYMVQSNSSATLADALDNCWFLSTSFRNQYNNTILF